ncbi:hypothetical protein CI610_01203 [invertebrate metagenome]|uniref:N-acetyltransferase domain-containing protein n=1 Tax=invertebrate metagenome TaxID=1711999 RepID=A0A2H9T9I5_9ZZZZ
MIIYFDNSLKKYKMMTICRAHHSDYPIITDLWESSVRASHNFLREEDIRYFKPLILNQYLSSVHLYCVKSRNNEILGFVGVAEKK